jgi:hypothetical protein
MPGIKAAFHGVHTLEAVVQQYLRRTGAGRFLMSRAVSDD